MRAPLTVGRREEGGESELEDEGWSDEERGGGFERDSAGGRKGEFGWLDAGGVVGRG